MDLLRQTKPQCLLYSFAMILGESPEVLIEEIGNDGLSVWWPEASGVRQLRGHHIQEMIDLCIARHLSVTCIDGFPCFAPPDVNTCHGLMLTPDQAEKRLQDHMMYHDGVLIGEVPEGPHAMAWNHEEQTCYDPRGHKYTVDNDFAIREFWLVARMI